MNDSSTSMQIMIHDEQRGERDTRLHGRWLLLARLVWLALALFMLGVALASQPASFAILHQPCPAEAMSCNGASLLAASQIQGLPKIGLSLDTYAWYTIVIYGLVGLISVVIGCILFWRRSDDWMVLLVTMMFVSQGAVNATNFLQFSSSIWGVLHNGVELIDSLAILLTLALFPNGWFVPRWGRWIVLAYPAYVVLYLVFLNQLHLPGWVLFNNPVNGVLWFGCWILLTLAQLYRYFRVSTPVEKQQTKWVAFTFFLVLVLGIVGTVTEPMLHSLLHNGFLYVFTADLGPIIVFFFPLSICIAILRYRLWDIDRIINRTLVYGSLTAILALLYVGLIVASQSLLGVLIKQSNNEVAIVVSTLAIAALFQPLRRRIQNIIDHRFYRRKYDAARTVETFSATLRNEVDLSQLSEHLVAVVQETMQPAHVSLWLRSSERRDASQGREMNRQTIRGGVE